MKSSPATVWEAGSLIAGLLIGLSIVVLVFAMMDMDSADWQTGLVLGAPIVLALGITLQIVVTNKPRHRRTTDLEPGALPIRFMKLSDER